MNTATAESTAASISACDSRLDDDRTAASLRKSPQAQVDELARGQPVSSIASEPAAT
jgi:hypothetical protein